MDRPPAEVTPALDMASLRAPLERPRALLWAMFGWCLAAFVATGIVGFVTAVFHSASGLAGGVPPTILLTTSEVTVQTVLLSAAFHRAKRIGWQGSRVDGFGFRPMQRPWILLLLALIPVIYNGLYWVGRTQFPMPVFPAGSFSLEPAFAAGGVAARTVFIVANVVLAPVSEELFFRGWLWTGLRRFWFPFPAMIGTALPWLLLHVLDDIHAPQRLLPQAIAFSLARHYCGSVRASIALHVLNNAIVMAMLVSLYAH